MHPERERCQRWAAVKERWKDTWERRRDKVLKELAYLVNDSHLVGMGAVVDAEHFRAMPDSKFKQEMNNPLYLSFYNIIRNSLEYIDFVFPRRHHQLAVVIDDDHEYSMKCYQLFTAMCKQFPKEVGDRVDQIAFGKDAGYSGLQAADMFAYLARDWMIQQKADPNSVPSELYAALTKGGLHRPGLLTSQELDHAARIWEE